MNSLIAINNLNGLAVSFLSTSSSSSSLSDSSSASSRVPGNLLMMGAELLLTMRVSAETPGASHWEGRLQGTGHTLWRDELKKN